jgi:hypothetical protein
VAFLYLDLVLQLFSTYEYSELYADASSEIRPTLHRQKLDVPLAPTLGAMWGGQSVLSTRTREPSGFTRVVDFLNVLCGAAFLLTPLGFLVWAYVVVFERFGPGDVVVWFSLVASVVCVARAVGIAASWLVASGERQDEKAPVQHGSRGSPVEGVARRRRERSRPQEIRMPDEKAPERVEPGSPS